MMRMDEVTKLGYNALQRKTKTVHILSTVLETKETETVTD